MSALLRISITFLFAATVAIGQEISPESDSGKGLTVDEQISRHVRKQADEERKKRMDFMGFVIDDIVRLCELNDAQKERLVLAAKGASKRSMERWHEQAERYFRQRVSGSDEETVNEMLQNMGNVNFGGRDSDREGETEAVWKDSLKDVLSAEQLSKYDTVLAERTQARIDAFSEMAIASLDSYLRLTPQQKAKMSPIINSSANEYLDDIHRYWGEYVEKNMLMSLANAADEKTLKEILSDRQYERLQSATSNLEHFWEQRRRLKKAKNDADQRKNENGDQRAEAIKIDGNIKAGGKVVIKAANGGAVRIQPGAIFRGGEIEIEAGEITIEE
ncbi:MAG: hypothetical protein P1U89_03615 [Verrucomicrobiales bacterium]|nr:hypothetical protein [Verrucomicrobiales bacterium]